MSTTIKTEQRILNLETVSGIIKLSAEVRLSLTGEIINAYGQIQLNDQYIGSFNINQIEDKLNSNISINDSTVLSNASSAINELISDLDSLI